ncbi:hypothetical protein AZI86_14075 [Bdellovibrio bacteriovorus]|uniref:Lipoprotein n=1 Tax=Bdellovibrio bacteriovorus TaxID=959 RepID=A0A150WK28_BDEBC|nr:hypothetical protein [Bdellovibrio bacteriovorus]KYG63935.1 hypothetical protein AZI86_14075 [Bdellovibrio bacteriovorus]
MKSFKPFTAVLIAALALSACAKKDSDFAAKYKTNKMGAEATNVEETAAADQVALGEGIDIDIVKIDRALNGSEKVMTSVVAINNYQFSLTTRHAALELRTGTMNVGNNVRIDAAAVCANANCTAYYVLVNAYKDNKLVIQEGVRKYFEVSTTSLDRYAKLKAERALPLVRANAWTSADMYDGTVMVGYLNGNATSGTYIK